MTEQEQRLVILVRHGELHNPRNITYNRDSSMRPEDIMHLSEDGRTQMMLLAKTLIGKGLKVSQIIASPEIRTQESAAELCKALGVDAFKIADDLDDSFVPGPYLEGMKTSEIKAMEGDYYWGPRWEKYNHEKPREIIERMRRAIWNMADRLKPGDAGILVSHGDPIAWVANYLISGIIPLPRDLRNHIYPTKGQALLLSLELQNRSISNYTTIDNPKEGSIY